MADPARQYRLLSEEIDAAARRLLASGAYIGGEAVAAFESELAAFLGVPPEGVISCANGTDALELAYEAVGLRPGDEVIIPTHNYVAAAEAALRLGLVPVWADCGGAEAAEQCYNLDAHALEPLIGPQTRAVVAVNLYGMPFDAPRLKAFCAAHNLILIEDNAQGMGGYARVAGELIPMGCLGDISTTSFFPTKPLGCAGDGGAIVTTRLDWAERARCLARHGQGEKYDYQLVGRNSRLDALQAEILRIKLRHLGDFIDGARAIAARYTEVLSAVAGLMLPIAGGHLPTYHQYTLLLPEGAEREVVRGRLIEAGIASGLYYPRPLHAYSVYAARSVTRSSLSRSEAVSQRMLSLPIFPLMQPREADHVLSRLGLCD